MDNGKLKPGEKVATINNLQMKYGKLVLYKEEFLMIKKYQAMNLTVEDYNHKNILEILNQNMAEALIFDFDELPGDIIRMYSDITLKCTSGWQEILQLVPPFEEDVKRNKISVVSSLGASVIGLSQGDKIVYGLPGSSIGLEIVKVVQHTKKVLLTISEEELKRILSDQAMNSLTL